MKVNAHIPAGHLKAYSDKELDKTERERVRAHLVECSHCQEQLERMTSLTRQVQDHLAILAPSSSQVHPTVSAARARFASHIAEKEKTSMLQKIFAPRYRPAWAALGLILILAVALAFPPVRAIANSFLGLFRVQQFAVVQVNPGDLPEQLGSSSLFEQLLSQDIAVEEMGEAMDVSSAEEASQIGGIAVRLPTEIEGERRLKVQPGAKATFEVDTRRIQAVLNEIGHEDIKIPASLDGATVTMEFPTSVGALYGECEASLESAREEGYDPHIPTTPRLIRCTTLVQMPSPTVQAPPGLDLAQIGESFLQVMGMTPEEAAQFSQTVDWTTTLVIPVPRYGTSYDEVDVDSVDGILIKQDLRDDAQQYMLIWVKDDILYALTGPGDKSTALRIANSLE